jgi:hypothetical protein
VLCYRSIMRLPLGPEFRDEWRRFDFRFCCEDCAHHLPGAAGEAACAHGWPEAEHLREFYTDPDCRELVFCKEFELR